MAVSCSTAQGQCPLCTRGWPYHCSLPSRTLKVEESAFSPSHCISPQSLPGFLRNVRPRYSMLEPNPTHFRAVTRTWVPV